MSTKEESNLLLNQTAEDLLIGDDVEFENADNEQASSHSEEEEQSSEEEEQSDEEEDEEDRRVDLEGRRRGRFAKISLARIAGRAGAGASIAQHCI